MQVGLSSFLLFDDDATECTHFEKRAILPISALLLSYHKPQ